MSKSSIDRPNPFQQIARVCNVSPASVTLALQDSPRISEETKYRVYLAGREIGYRKSKVRGHKHLQFAIFHGQIHSTSSMSGNTYFDTWYGVTRAINNIEATLNIYELNLMDGKWDFATLPSQFKRDQFDGIIVTGVAGKAFLDFLEQVKMPVVVASNMELRSNVDQICFDYEHAAGLAVEEMLAYGKRRIGFLSPGSGLLIHQALFRGYKAAMDAAGCFDPALVEQAEKSYDHEGRMPDALLRRCPDLEMIFATNPRTAHQAALAAALHGVPAPEGVQFISMQNETHRELRYWTHVLCSDHGNLGESAVKRLLERRERQDFSACTILLKCRLLLDPRAFPAAGAPKAKRAGKAKELD